MSIERKYRVMLTRAEIDALLAVCPRCRNCSQRGEIMINGRLLCTMCAASEKGAAKIETPDWTNACVSLEEALSPFTPTGGGR